MQKFLVLVACLFAIVQGSPLLVNKISAQEQAPIAQIAEFPVIANANNDSESVAVPKSSAIPIEDTLHDFVETVRFGLPTGRVINGHEAPEHSAPYIVSLGPKAKTHTHQCGGTIIDKEWIATAGHCITKSAVGLSVVAGLHSRNDIGNFTQRRTVDFGKVHNEFGGGVGPYDIALLHVSEPFEYTDIIQSAVLPAWEEQHTGEGHIYGWGQPTWYNIFGSTKLQTVTTDILTFEECAAKITEENSPLRKSNICTASRGEGISSCNGDSGGPLVIEHEGQPAELIGIVSWGYIPCGVANKPSVFTRVSAYKDWINYIISSYEALQPHFL